MAMQIEVAVHGEVDDLLDQRPGSGVAGDVKLADAKLTDVTSRAHLEETRARIKAALEAQIAKGVE